VFYKQPWGSSETNCLIRLKCMIMQHTYELNDIINVACFIYTSLLKLNGNKLHVPSALTISNATFYMMWSRVSSGSIVSDYGLGDRGSIPGGGRGFFL
jgi:hypothetical protein